MHHSTARPRSGGRTLQVVFLLGAVAVVFSHLLGSVKGMRRDRRQQIEALQTWEGEGGAVKGSDSAAQTAAR